MSGFKFKARLGNTTYTLIKPGDVTAANIEVTRINRDGITKIYIPEELLVQYAKHWLLKQMPDLINRMK